MIRGDDIDDDNNNIDDDDDKLEHRVHDYLNTYLCFIDSCASNLMRIENI